MRTMILSLTTLAISLSATAQPPSAMRPTRDVEVTYQSGLTAGDPRGNRGPITMHFSAATGKMRIDMGSGRGYVIADHNAGKSIVVMMDKQMYMEQPNNPAMATEVGDIPPDVTKAGTDTVAGLPCTIYQSVSKDHQGQVCLTDDGVLLRARGHSPDHTSELTAIKVTYVTQPASLFEPPPGFRKFDMPNIPGMPPGGMPGAGQMPPHGMMPNGAPR